MKPTEDMLAQAQEASLDRYGDAYTNDILVKRVAQLLADQREALVEVVTQARGARLKVPVECLVEAKREAFAAGAIAMHDEVIDAIRGGKDGAENQTT